LDAVGCSFALLRRVCWPTLEECYAPLACETQPLKSASHYNKNYRGTKNLSEPKTNTTLVECVFFQTETRRSEIEHISSEKNCWEKVPGDFTTTTTSTLTM
jgi:hypothetical protein